MEHANADLSQHRESESLPPREAPVTKQPSATRGPSVKRERRTAMDQGLWDVQDVASFLKMSVRWVQRMAQLGALPHVRISRKALRFDPAKIRAYARGEWTPPPPKAA